MKTILLSILAISLTFVLSTASGAYSYYAYICGNASGNAQLLERLYNNPNVLNPFVRPAIRNNSKKLLERLYNNPTVLNPLITPVVKGNAQLVERLYNNPDILNVSCANKK